MRSENIIRLVVYFSLFSIILTSSYVISTILTYDYNLSVSEDLCTIKSKRIDFYNSKRGSESNNKITIVYMLNLNITVKLYDDWNNCVLCQCYYIISDSKNTITLYRERPNYEKPFLPFISYLNLILVVFNLIWLTINTKLDFNN